MSSNTRDDSFRQYYLGRHNPLSSLYTLYTQTEEPHIQTQSKCSLSDPPSPVCQGPSSQELHPYIPLLSPRNLWLTMSRRPLPTYVMVPFDMGHTDSPVEQEGRREACCWYRDWTGDRRFRQGDCRYVVSLSPRPSIPLPQVLVS